MKTLLKFFIWKYFINFFPWLEYIFYKMNNNQKRKPESAEINRIVSELRINGYSVSSFDKIGLDIFIENQNRLKLFKDSHIETITEEIMGSKNLASKNKYQLNLMKIFDEKASQSAYTIINHPVFNSISNQYFGMTTKFWDDPISMFTIKSKKKPTLSQLWHKDPEDKLILKYFIFLSDIKHENGPFHYAPKTHYFGHIKDKPKSFQEFNAPRITDKSMERLIRSEDWFKGVGKKGTIVFADTRGYHKGGYVQNDSRWILQGCYVSSNAFKENKSL